MSQSTFFTTCPVCNSSICSASINSHLDSGCKVGIKIDHKKDLLKKSNPEDSVQKSPSKVSSFFRNYSKSSSSILKSKESSPVTSKRFKKDTEDAKPISIDLDSSSEDLQVSPIELKKETTEIQKVKPKENIPLAELVRPQTIDDFFGQEDLMGKSGLLKRLLDSGKLPSLLFWGPPGCGKTTLAKILGRTWNPPVNFKAITSVTHGIDEVKKIIEQAKNHRKLTNQHTILFVDEIHRYSKSQQDYFLPAVEIGTITLLAATTENPSFRINSALLSRCKVFVLEKLSQEAMLEILQRAQQVKLSQLDLDPSLECASKLILDDGLSYIGRVSDGDARHAINALEMVLDAIGTFDKSLDANEVEKIIKKTHMAYDKTGEEHYNLASALQKSIRGSSVEGALYWLGRMLYSGEDPMFIARRLVIIASEDIGLADSSALPLAVATFQSCQFIGMPECDIILAHCTAYLARAPKSTLSYRTIRHIKNLVKEAPSYPVPHHIRNAPTKLMKDLGYGDGYIYTPSLPPNDPASLAQTYLPPQLEEDGTGDTLRKLMQPDFPPPSSSPKD